MGDSIILNKTELALINKMLNVQSTLIHLVAENHINFSSENRQHIHSITIQLIQIREEVNKLDIMWDSSSFLDGQAE